MTFFKSLQSAMAYFKATYGPDSLVGNAIVESDPPCPSVAGARRGGGWCGIAWIIPVALPHRYGPYRAPALRPLWATGEATLAAFQSLQAAQGTERVSGGCCTPEYKMTFQILSVIGTLTAATATYRTTYFKR